MVFSTFFYDNRDIPGIGVVSISQFTIAGFALAQVAAAYSLVAQVGLYIHEGHGQAVKSLMELIGKL